MEKTELPFLLDPSSMSRAGVVVGLDMSALPNKPRSLRSSPEKRRSSCSDFSSPERIYKIMNVDIPPRDFVNAVNFDQITSAHMDSLSPRKDNGFSAGSDLENSMNSLKRAESLEILDQQQKIEKTRLLERFKLMREFQRLEQERLMKQQEEQLEQLRKEQDRAHYILMRQREDNFSRTGFLNSPSQSPRKHSPRKFSSPPRYLKRSPEKAYLRSPNRRYMSREEAYYSDQDCLAYRDVDCGSIASDFYPLPETASEATEQVIMHAELEDMENDVETMMQVYMMSRRCPTMMTQDVDSEEQLPVMIDTSENDKNAEELKTPPIEERKNDVDEIPIAGSAKTFEELLEEQLQIEEEKLKNEYTTATKNKYTPKRKHFLRKGRGTTRYNQPYLKSPLQRRPLANNEKRDKNEAVDIEQKANSSANVKTLNDGPTQKLENPVDKSVADVKAVENGQKDTWKLGNKNELDELEEFEMLEQYADHPSFRSDASLIQRVIAPSETKKSEKTAFQRYLDNPQLHGKSDVEESESECDDVDEDGTLSHEDEVDNSFSNKMLQRKVACRNNKVDDLEALMVKSDNQSEGSDDVRHDLDGDDDDDDDDYQSASECENEKDAKQAINQFDDDDEWDAFSNDGSLVLKAGPLDASTPPSVKRKSGLSIDNDRISDSPPTSALMTKLFPSLKPLKPKASAEEIEMQKKMEAARQPSQPVDGAMSKVLREKLAELESEIEKFQSENVTLMKMKKEREEGLEKLRKEMDAFEKQKNAELKNLEEYKENETKTLKKERKLFEKYQRESRAIPDKKEREEIELLKSQVLELKDEMHRKESRWIQNSNRQRTRIEQLEQDNMELKDEVRLLEKKRLELLQKQENSKNEKKSEIPIKKPFAERDVFNNIQQNSKYSESYKNIQALSQSKNIDGYIAKTTCTIDNKKLVERAIKTNTTDMQRSNIKPANVVIKSVPTRQQILRSSVEMEDADDEDTYHDEDTLLTCDKEEMPRTNISLMNSCSATQVGVPEIVIEKRNIPRKRQMHFSLDTARVDKGDLQFEEVRHKDGKVEKMFSNGAREIIFTNGTRKDISADGQSIIVSFFNGDLKQVMPDKRVVYYYADAQTTHTTYPDQLEILQFPNNQIEKHYPDGTREITFPDHTMKYLFPNGAEESIFGDGTVIRVEANGDKTMDFPNGQRELHTKEYKRREYPDGTVKTVYPDGRQETRYSSGRLRVKDKEGNIIIDRRC